jgi:hypothetical protein
MYASSGRDCDRKPIRNPTGSPARHGPRSTFQRSARNKIGAANGSRARCPTIRPQWRRANRDRQSKPTGYTRQLPKLPLLGNRARGAFGNDGRHFRVRWCRCEVPRQYHPRSVRFAPQQGGQFTPQKFVAEVLAVSLRALPWTIAQPLMTLSDPTRKSPDGRRASGRACAGHRGWLCVRACRLGRISHLTAPALAFLRAGWWRECSCHSEQGGGEQGCRPCVRRFIKPKPGGRGRARSGSGRR